MSSAPLPIHANPNVPALPSNIRYWDDFADAFRIIENPLSNEWGIYLNGRSTVLNFPAVEVEELALLKAVIAELLVERSAVTAVTYFRSLASLERGLLAEILKAIASSDPPGFAARWTKEFRRALVKDNGRAVRFVLHCACRWNYGAWRETDAALVRQLDGHSIDKYRAAREGSCFVPVRDQSIVVDFIDQTARRVQSGRASRAELQIAAVLALSFQYGLRRGQIARLGHADVVVHGDETVHVRVRLLKQRGQARARTVIRSLQVGWAPLFRELVRGDKDLKNGKFFDATPDEIAATIGEATLELTGIRYSVGDFRHTAAQRLVDNGASRDEVTDFLGHSDHTAADVYFAASPQQADLVDAALGRSAIYRKVAEVAKTKTISVTDLAALPADEQIAAMPHGIPISGIGACTAGQSLCQRNPVIACYTCHKFLAVEDKAIHQQVLEDLQNVVVQFDQPNRIDRVSPAMLQLRSTLEAVSTLVGAAGRAQP